MEKRCSPDAMQLITVVWQQSTLLEFSYRFFDVGKIMEKYQQKKVRLFVYGMSMPALPNQTLPFVQLGVQSDYFIKTKFLSEIFIEKCMTFCLYCIEGRLPGVDKI
jgi:hypothetical protein